MPIITINGQVGTGVVVEPNDQTLYHVTVPPEFLGVENPATPVTSALHRLAW